MADNAISAEAMFQKETEALALAIESGNVNSISTYLDTYQTTIGNILDQLPDQVVEIYTQFIEDVHDYLFPVERDLHIYNFSADLTNTETRIFLAPIGIIPRKFIGNMRIHSFGFCGNDARIKVYYMKDTNVVDTWVIDIPMGTAAMPVDLNERATPFWVKWIGFINSVDWTIPFYHDKNYYSSGTFLVDEVPMDGDTINNIYLTAKLNNYIQNIQLDVGICYETDADETGISV